MAIPLQVVGVITAVLEQHAAQPALPGQDAILSIGLQAVSGISKGNAGQPGHISAAAGDEHAKEAHAIALEVLLLSSLCLSTIVCVFLAAPTFRCVSLRM